MPAISLSESIAKRFADAIPLTKVPDFIPGRPNISTCWRWASKGVRGVKLATIIIGGRRYVTLAALEDFLESLNTDTPATKNDTDADMARRAREASHALADLGC